MWRSLWRWKHNWGRGSDDGEGTLEDENNLSKSGSAALPLNFLYWGSDNLEDKKVLEDEANLSKSGSASASLPLHFL